jgi:hypothetical protein
MTDVIKLNRREIRISILLHTKPEKGAQRCFFFQSSGFLGLPIGYGKCGMWFYLLSKISLSLSDNALILKGF